MAIGKNKRLSKGKKGGKRKVVDPMSRKEWYDLKAPAGFANRDFGKTVVNRTAGLKISADSLRGRVVEVNLADLTKSEANSSRKMKFVIDDVQGTKCLTNFYGLELTRDKLCSMIRKRQSLVEATVDVKTTDGFVVRIFCIGFTARRRLQVKATAYATSAQVGQIRKKMADVLTREVGKADVKELMSKLVSDSIPLEVIRACRGTFPLQNVHIRKVKVLRAPKFDHTRLQEIHADPEGTKDVGAPVERVEETVPVLAGSGGRL